MKAAFEKRETIAIHESSNFDRIIKFANSGCGMSDRWWSETYQIKDNDELLGVYQTPSGKLRRITIWG